MRGQFAKLAAIALGLAATMLSLPLVAGFFSPLHPSFDSLAHFRIHLAAALAAAALLLFAFRGWRLNAAIALALSCAATFVTTGLPLGSLRAVAGNEGMDLPRYRLMQMNLRYDNPHPEAVFSLVGELRPDVLTLNEVSDMWRERLDRLSAAYPYSLICQHRAHIGGSAILSRRPFVGDPRCEDSGSLTVATIDFGGQRIDVAALHLGWPWPFDQPRQVRNLMPLLAKLGDRAILAGDFNATPWSASVRRVAEAGGLRLTRWVGPTWLDRRLPAALRPYVGLPIDHVMAKGGVLVDAPMRLPASGSDHLPVLVEFTLLPEERAPDRMQAAAGGAGASSG